MLEIAKFFEHVLIQSNVAAYMAILGTKIRMYGKEIPEFTHHLFVIQPILGYIALLQKFIFRII